MDGSGDVCSFKQDWPGGLVEGTITIVIAGSRNAALGYSDMFTVARCRRKLGPGGVFTSECLGPELQRRHGFAGRAQSTSERGLARLVDNCYHVGALIGRQGPADMGQA